MSVNSATKTFTDGAKLFDQEKYQSTVTTSVELYPIQTAQTIMRPLSHCIIPINSQTKNIDGEDCLDAVIDLGRSNAALRKHQTELWNRVKKEAETGRWQWTAIGIGSGVVTIVGGVLINIFDSPFVPISIVAGAALAITSTALTIKANSWYNRAQTQINIWDQVQH